jgi:phosphoribosylglycinamide formyltransferase
MEAAVAHAPPAPALRRSLALSPTPAVRPDPKPCQGVVLSARRQSHAVRCEPPRRPEARLRAAAAAQPGGADAAAAGRRKRLAVFVSGGGSNVRAIHEAALGGPVHGDVVALVTDKPGEGSCTPAKLPTL